MADAGSQQIRDLLDADSVSMTKSGKRLVTAVKRSTKRDDGVPAPMAFAALSDIRRSYAQLSGEIASVETTNPAQSDVVSALVTFDQGLAVLEEALQAGVNETGGELAREAKKLTKRAARELKAARAAL
jgi:hypothetical protein